MTEGREPDHGTDNDHQTAAVVDGVPEPETLGEMESPPLGVHPRRQQYDLELNEIKDEILRMGMLVESQIQAAIAALVTHDPDAALQVILDDRKINDVQRDATTRIAATIATQAPVARDLRYLLTLDHVSYELERMGDHAGSVAKQARKLAPNPPLKNYVHLPTMGRQAAALVRDILEAVVEIDAELAKAVAARDDDLDELYHTIFAEVLDLMRADPANVDPGMRIIFAAHYLERVGDRVTNIAEDVVFLATGEVTELNE